MMTTVGRQMVNSAHTRASEAGLEMLRRGGNAVDAAVAAAFTLGVVEPQNSGLGGYGGYALYYDHKSDQVIGVEFNTRAPEAVHNPRDILPVGPTSMGVPGVLDGLSLLLSKYGTLPLSSVLQPAIDAAEHGFELSSGLLRALSEPDLQQEVKDVLIEKGTMHEGERLRNPRYGKLLREIGASGSRAFYEGRIARLIAEDVQRQNGLLTYHDLASYSARVFTPKPFSFNGFSVYVPDENSGGPIARRLLELYEQTNLGAKSEGLDSVLERIPFVAQAFEEARPYHLSHPPIAATAQHTTHLSAVDEKWNMVAITLTHGPRWFGSGVVIGETGMVMNNGLSLFSAVSGAANSYAPGARPVVNLCPTLVSKDGVPYLTVGTPGGTRIPTAVGNFLFDVLQGKMDPATAVVLPRFHAERRDEWWFEEPLYQRVAAESPVKATLLRRLRPEHFYGPMSCILCQPDGTKRLFGATDPRFPGAVGAN